MSMNSGPPRLRVDNAINLRLGANSMDESFDDDSRKHVPVPVPFPMPRETPTLDADTEAIQGVVVRDMAQSRLSPDMEPEGASVEEDIQAVHFQKTNEK
jgi:hypothetical protein